MYASSATHRLLTATIKRDLHGSTKVADFHCLGVCDCEMVCFGLRLSCSELISKHWDSSKAILSALALLPFVSHISQVF